MSENTAEYPVQGQMTPDFWDTVLKNYIDNGDSLSIPAQTVTRIVKLTQSEYDALEPKIDTTLYVVVPDSGLLVNGTITMNDSDAIVVGSGDVLADNDDETYFENTSAVGLTLDHNIGIEPLVTDGVLLSAVLNIRASVENHSPIIYPGDGTEMYLFLQDGNPTEVSSTFYVAQFIVGDWNDYKVWDLVPDEGILDIALPLVLRPGKTMADVQTVLESGEALLVVDYFSNAEAEDTSTTICRLYNAAIDYTLA